MTIIVSRHDPDPPRALAIYIPLTTQDRGSLYEVVLPRLRFLDRDSIANVQGMASIPTVRLERKLGKLPDEVMLKIKQAMLFALDLEPDVSADNQSNPNES
jgi:mRNA interferase MazF